jgi:hypothetical protein
MEKSLIKYIGLVLVLCVIWNFLPKEKLPINDMYIFISLVLIIVFIGTNYIQPLFKTDSQEHFTTKNKLKKKKDKEHFTRKNKLKKKKDNEHFTTKKKDNEHFTTKNKSKKKKDKEHFNAGLSNALGVLGLYSAPGVPGVPRVPGAPSAPEVQSTVAISPIGTISYLSPSPSPAPAASILSPGASSLSLAQIKSLPQNERDQLVQAYLFDLYKGTKPSLTNPYVLSESEIIYYTGLYVSNLNDTVKMLKIRENISSIMRIDGVRGTLLLKLLNLAQINPELCIKIAASSPLKLIDIVNAMDSSVDLTDFVKSGSSKTIQLDLIKMLQNKIGSLETAVSTKVKADAGIPPAITEILSSNKFVDTKGMIKDIMYGDLKYNTQLTPGQMQPLGSYDNTFNNKWDNAYTILNTDKWRPPLGKTPVCKQEKECPVCPSMTSGYPLSVLDFDKSRYVMGPDNINIDYVNQLNNPFKN